VEGAAKKLILNMESIVVYSANNSTRLQYVLDWLLKERFHLDYRITSEEREVANLPFFISYGKQFPNSISIPDEGLLWEKEIKRPEPKTGLWNDVPVIFAATSEGFTLPFDLFSAVFFLISRYEEYYPFTPDKHGRYPATASILHKNGWLQRPLADEWVTMFRKLLVAAAPGLITYTPHFHFRPTYDIDMAYSHLYKGFGRIFGA
jgi:hypothetical protein